MDLTGSYSQVHGSNVAIAMLSVKWWIGSTFLNKRPFGSPQGNSACQYVSRTQCIPMVILKCSILQWVFGRNQCFSNNHVEISNIPPAMCKELVPSCSHSFCVCVCSFFKEVYLVLTASPNGNPFLANTWEQVGFPMVSQVTSQGDTQTSMLSLRPSYWKWIVQKAAKPCSSFKTPVRI